MMLQKSILSYLKLILFLFCLSQKELNLIITMIVNCFYQLIKSVKIQNDKVPIVRGHSKVNCKNPDKIQLRYLIESSGRMGIIRDQFNQIFCVDWLFIILYLFNKIWQFLFQIFQMMIDVATQHTCMRTERSARSQFDEWILHIFVGAHSVEKYR